MWSGNMTPLWTLAHICVAVGPTLCCPSQFLLMLWHILQVPSALSRLLWLASDFCAWLGRPIKFCFSLYAGMNCVTCWTFICCCYCQGAELLMCPGLLVPRTAFFYLFSPLQCPLVASLSSTERRTGNSKPTIPDSSHETG